MLEKELNKKLKILIEKRLKEIEKIIEENKAEIYVNIVENNVDIALQSITELKGTIEVKEILEGMKENLEI